MLPLTFPAGTLDVLVLSAHCDDAEIGAGGTLLRLAEEVPRLRVHVAALTSTPERAAEAQASAKAFLSPAELTVDIHGLRDGFLPLEWGRVKDLLAEIRSWFEPALVLCPSPLDAHQDHRTVGELVPTVFRDSLIWSYEIPKWDGDLGRTGASVYVPLQAEHMRRKCELLREHFPTQRSRDWFGDETFTSLGRLRGMECRARYAEAFACGKAVVVPSPTSVVSRGERA